MCNRTMKKKMIYQLPITTTHTTPIYQRATPKHEIIQCLPLTHPTSSPCSQRSDDFVPTKQSTLSTLESNSKYSSYASQSTDANKITIPPPILA